MHYKRGAKLMKKQVHFWGSLRHIMVAKQIYTLTNSPDNK